MRYDIEADWMLLETCNYRCAYCFFDEEVLGRKLRPAASPAEWRAAFDRTGRTWLLHLTGGEPGAYHGFTELCRELTQNHFISINTNLTQRAFADFAETIDPARVSFINAGYHPFERDRRGGQQVFAELAALLKAKGFAIMVSVVATPEALAAFPQIVDALRPTGLLPVPKLMRGPFEGRYYPDAYSAAEKRQFRQFTREARRAYGPLLAGRHHAITVNPFDDHRFLDGLPVYRGRSCEAGRKFVSIAPNGDVFRCSSHNDDGETLAQGNILQGSFMPAPGPAPCDTGYCFYFCNKYARRPGWSQTVRALARRHLPGRPTLPRAAE